jgi:hypothetical protein
MATNFGQKFTTSFVSGGARIHVQQDNPLVGGGNGTVSTDISLKLYTWNTNYATTIAGTPLVTDLAVVASEEIESTEMWVYLLWKPLVAGTYLWLLTVTFGYVDGTFQVLHDTGSTYHDAYEDGVNKAWDFHSGVMGLDAETYEFVLSLGDAFTTTYDTDGGHSGTKINRGSTGSPSYANSVKSQDAVVNGSNVKIGRIASGSLVKTG